MWSSTSAAVRRRLVRSAGPVEVPGLTPDSQRLIQVRTHVQEVPIAAAMSASQPAPCRATISLRAAGAQGLDEVR
jgi:hypothetical protein